MAVALRILPQHHDAVVVDTTSSRLGGAVLVAQPQHHAILRGHRIVRRGVAALGHDAAIHVVLLGLAQASSLRGVGHARWARRVAQAIQHRVDRGRVGGGYATAPSQRLKLGGAPRRDVAIQRFLHHRTLAVVQGRRAGGRATGIVLPQQGDDFIGRCADIHLRHDLSLNAIGMGVQPTPTAPAQPLTHATHLREAPFSRRHAVVLFTLVARPSPAGSPR